MEPTQTPQEVFAALKAILEPFAATLVVVKDGPDDFYLDTKYRIKNKQALFFGAVHIGKSYVSYHLMPVYACPDLLEGMSEGLRARMQGKSCFNFKRIDTVLFAELATLTQAGFDRFQHGGVYGAK